MIEMLHSRMERINSLIKQEVSEIILQEMKDPRIDFITISDVRTSKDLRSAVIYISTFEEEKVDEILSILEGAQGYIRRGLGNRITLRYLPKLIFKKDDTMFSARRIDEIIDKIHQEEGSDSQET